MTRMQPIIGPPTNYSAPDEAVAQSIAQSARWQIEEATGAICQRDGGYLAADLDELTAAMDALGWFVRAIGTGPRIGAGSRTTMR